MPPKPEQTTQLRNETLNGGRAERNEYILLHEFHKFKYICPDKTFGKKALKVEPEPDDAEGEGGGTKTTKGKRDKYKGGLVFPPDRKLWDKLILVIDFNSLYPSIIQEYNIGFTTVERRNLNGRRSESLSAIPASLATRERTPCRFRRRR